MISLNSVFKLEADVWMIFEKLLPEALANEDSVAFLPGHVNELGAMIKSTIVITYYDALSLLIDYSILARMINTDVNASLLEENDFCNFFVFHVELDSGLTVSRLCSSKEFYHES